MSNEIIDLSVENKIITDIKELEFEQGDDYEFARRNMRRLLEKGGNALDNLISIADGLQSPSGYDALSTLLKTLIDGNKQLLNLKKTEKEIETISAETNETTTIENNLFITPNDLLDAVISNRTKTKDKITNER